MATFTTISTSQILDQLCAAVDAARVNAASAPAWLRAIDAGYDYLLTADTIEYSRADHALRVESASEPGRYYVANGDCQCPGYANGGVCWHRAAARLVRRALEAQPAPMGQRIAKARWAETERLMDELYA